MTEFPPVLPYPVDALEPYLSGSSVRDHRDRYHAAALGRVGTILGDVSLRNASLEALVRNTAPHECLRSLCRHAALAWNHELFWHSMRPGGGGPPCGKAADLIDCAYGGYAGFADDVYDAAERLPSDGWVWVVLKRRHLQVVASDSYRPPFLEGSVPLIVVDMAPHAYSADYGDRRDDYVRTFLDHLVDWDAMNVRLAAHPEAGNSAFRRRLSDIVSPG